MNTGIGIVVAILLTGLVIWAFRSAGDSSNIGGSPETELYRLCRGDKEMMERLIALELDRSPGSSRTAAAKAAAYAIKRDNR